MIFYVPVTILTSSLGGDIESYPNTTNYGSAVGPITN